MSERVTALKIGSFIADSKYSMPVVNVVDSGVDAFFSVFDPIRRRMSYCRFWNQ